MIFQEPAPFVKNFVDAISLQLESVNKTYKLSRIQRYWLSFCVMGIFITGTIAWSKFEKFGLKKYPIAALSWMLRHSKIMWDLILICAVRVILRKYSIRWGHLIIDDTDIQRSKSTTKIDRVHKIFDKKTNGYFMGQNIILILLVTDKVTIPVGFKFYFPDAKKTEWMKKDKELRKQGIPKSERPKPQKNDPQFPTKIQCALTLLQMFKTFFPAIEIRSVSADALYGSKDFFREAKKIFPFSQIVSQLKSNQKVWFKNTLITVAEAVSQLKQTQKKLLIRGGDEKLVTIASAKMRVDRHKKTRFIIALKYDGEGEFRYIVASDMTWHPLDIAKTYSLRWLIEVYFSDWKLYEGFGQMALQQGADGSCRCVILSLLSDLCLLFHPDQIARITNKIPAATVGSRKEQIKNEALLHCLETVVLSASPYESFNQIKDTLSDLFKIRESSKHMVNRRLDDMRPAIYIRRRAEVVGAMN